MNKQNIIQDYNPDIMFIGETPDRMDEIENLTQDIYLNGKKIYITSVVKCKLPGDRNPNRREIKDNSKWLENQIKLIKPKLIILVGRIALKRFFPNLELLETHGKKIEKHIPKIGSFTFLPTYRPVVDYLKIREDLENV